MRAAFVFGVLLTPFGGCGAPTGSGDAEGTETGGELASVEILSIEVWQGPPLVLFDGELVDPLPPIVRGRNMHVWMRVRADPEWKAETTGTFEVWEGGDEPAWAGTLTHALDGDWVASYSFEVPGEVLTADSELVIRLSAYGEDVLRVPSEGRVRLADAARPSRLGLTLQPIHWQVDDCDTNPELGTERLAMYGQRLRLLLPIEGVDLEVADAVTWTESVDELAPVVEYLQARRVELAVAPERLFVGLLDPCANQLGGAGGLARDIVPDASPEHASSRVAAIVSGEPEATADRLVHESGHLLGRRHVLCVDEPDPDPAYPYEGGKLPHAYYDAEAGDFVLEEPLYEVMSYCRPYGTSAYGWRRFSEMLVGLTEAGGE